MNVSPAFRGIVRNICTTVTLIGLCLLGVVGLEAYEGKLVALFFPGMDHSVKHQAYALLLSLPVPLHVVFIGLIIQKQWLTRGMARFAWIGIVVSGLWLGAALAVKALVL
ncbi:MULTISPECIES: hypothetical protein [unclassified Pseudodesulfovibrio]|uniref:hypothetical protein n=1 Tax=unclassified Pseudodesulfovibrio TaxID=2661612 RepID=UPI000FEBA0D1|nr:MULTISPECIES: hypothetical protein [unclassified Pseudodesulfovibrio]MCJ2165545.1 hypothetical protein [Pseudodesulfovibrio sp. S3-i]RWU03094.1 hypothetical protein DWB63_12880 [Pseudodesulfovibrio sp. S3]